MKPCETENERERERERERKWQSRQNENVLRESFAFDGEIRAFPCLLIFAPQPSEDLTGSSTTTKLELFKKQEY